MSVRGLCGGCSPAIALEVQRSHDCFGLCYRQILSDTPNQPSRPSCAITIYIAISGAIDDALYHIILIPRQQIAERWVLSKVDQRSDGLWVRTIPLCSNLQSLVIGHPCKSELASNCRAYRYPVFSERWAGICNAAGVSF